MNLMDWTVVVSTIIGALIAGIVGIGSVYTSRYLDRRERHLNEHKDNFKNIDIAISQLRDNIWPLHYGQENLKLPNPEYHFTPESVRYGILGVSIFIPRGGGNQAEIVKVNKPLYGDITQHFKKLAEYLSTYEETIKTDGMNINELLYEISEKIYSELDGSEISLLNWPFKSDEKVQFKNLNNELAKQEYAGVIFLLVTGEDENTWPNTKSIYETYNLLGGLKRIADKVNIDLGEKVQEMIRLLEGLDKLSVQLHNLLEEELRNFKLKGSCEFVRF